jgi:heavy metal translocating P-type ATPase
MTALASSVCDYCGLPLRAAADRGRAAGPVFCCLGCRLAAAIAQEKGEAGQMHWTMARLLTAVFFTMNVMAFTMALWARDVYPFDSPESATTAAMLEDLFRYLCLVFSLPVCLLLGGPLVESAWQGGRRGVLGTDLLLVFGVAASYVYSSVSVFRGQGHVYFEVGCMVLVAVTLGRWLEASAKRKTCEAIESLRKLLPATVRRIAGGRQEDVPLPDITAGDLLRILPGERIPTDGRVVRGEAMIDRQVVSGESVPDAVEPGDLVPGGALSLDGELFLKATARADEGTLGRLIGAVRQAALRKGSYERSADRLAAWLIPSVFVLSLATFGWHWFCRELDVAILAGLSVLLLACPCALGLATPMAAWVAMGRASRAGVLFRESDALLRLASAKAVCFDKTGTLTSGDVEVDDVVADESTMIEDVLEVATSLALSSSHALSASINRHAAAERRFVGAAHARALPGRGVQGEMAPDVGTAYLGSPRLMNEMGLACSAPLSDALSRFSEQGRPIVCVGWGGRLRGVFVFRENLRVEVPRLIEWLKRNRYHIAVLTGDSSSSAATLQALRAAGDTYPTIELKPSLLPEDKLRAVDRIRKSIGPVVMVGEGLNDAPALAGADVGVALGEGTDVARNSADVCLISNDLMKLPWAIDLSKQTVRTMKRNLFWALFYNGVGLPIAAAGALNPILAALAMLLSSFFVVSGSLALGCDGDPL